MEWNNVRGSTGFLYKIHVFYSCIFSCISTSNFKIMLRARRLSHWINPSIITVWKITKRTNNWYWYVAKIFVVERNINGLRNKVPLDFYFKHIVIVLRPLFVWWYIKEGINLVTVGTCNKRGCSRYLFQVLKVMRTEAIVYYRVGTSDHWV